MTEEFDAVVVGLGGIGSGAAYWLARRGLKVLGLERFGLGHERGASQDHSRIIRRSYHTPGYVRMAGQAYEAWASLERDAGESLIVRTGGLDLWPAGAAVPMEDYSASLEACDVAFETLDGAEVMRRWPQWKLEDDVRAIFQSDGGIAPAARCNAAHRRMAEAHGAMLREHAEVAEIHSVGGEVELRVGDNRYRAPRVVLATDAWTNELLGQLGAPLPLTILREQVTYYQAPDPDAFAPEQFPVWIWMDEPSFYGFPTFGEPGPKAAQDCGGHPTTLEEQDVHPRPRRVGPGRRLRPAPPAGCLRSAAGHQDVPVHADPRPRLRAGPGPRPPRGPGRPGGRPRLQVRLAVRAGDGRSGHRRDDRGRPRAVPHRPPDPAGARPRHQLDDLTDHEEAHAMTKGLRERLSEGVVLGDGGYLLELEKRGYVRGGPFTPEVSLTHPEALLQLHREFLRAGSEVIQALTFYASEDKLATVGLAGKGDEMNRAAVRIAREAASEGDALVAGNLALTWSYDPKDPSSADRVRAQFDRQLEVQVDEGIDLVIGETFTWLGEALLAAERAMATGLPVIVTMSFEKDPRSYEGDAPAECARRLAGAGVDVVGVNCLRGPRHTMPIAREMAEAVEVPVATQPVGYRTTDEQPDFTSMAEFPFQLDPLQLSRQEMADYAVQAREAGVAFIGACCGTVASHIREMARALGKKQVEDEPIDWQVDFDKPMSAYEYYRHEGRPVTAG